MNREEAYEEGLEMGRAAFEDGIKHGHDFFVNITPRYMLANSRYAPLLHGFMHFTNRFLARSGCIESCSNLPYVSWPLLNNSRNGSRFLSQER
jgi:hypothetical protein